MSITKPQFEKMTKVENDPFTQYLICEATLKFWKSLTGLNFNYYFKELDYVIFYKTESRNLLQTALRSNPVLVEKFFNLIEKEHLNYVKYAEDLASAGRKDLSDEKLKQFFNSFTRYYGSALSIIYLPFDMEVILVEKIKSFLPEGAESKECLDIFSAPLKPSETLKQRLALLRLAVEYTQNKISKQELDDKLKSHHGEFSWLNMLGLRGKPYDFEFFRGQFDEAVAEGPERELDNLLKIQSSHDEKINQKLQELSASEELKKQVHSLRKLIYLRTWRLERISLGNFYIRPFLEAMAKRFNYTYDELIFLLPDEISRSLNGESIDKQVVHERQKSWGIIFDNDEIKFLQGKETDEYKDKVMVKTHGREIAGQTANKGFYRGVVKIIKRKKELDKIKKGDILVTEMTTPDFVPAMKNSGAIITDIGGITSHAAIVSRELGKPCIIATGNATKVLKDGDEVEVDADKGVVRKIGK